jgi:hypothetical protein
MRTVSATWSSSATATMSGWSITPLVRGEPVVVAKLVMPVGMAGEQVIKLLAEKRRLIGDHSTVQ